MNLLDRFFIWGHRMAESRTRLAPLARQWMSDPIRIQSVMLWVAAIAVGLTAVAYAKIFKFGEECFLEFAKAQPLAAFVITPFFFVMAWLLVRYLAPQAGGSGIPQILAANDMASKGKPHKAVDRLLSTRTAGTIIISSLVCVTGGGAIGPEGPTLHIASSLFHFFGRRFRKYYPKLNEQTFIVAGAAAGLASAFNTPLGGIVFAIEELGSAQFHRVRTALFSAVIISGLIAQWLLGSYLYLGTPQINGAGIEFIFKALLAGAISGIAGTMFSLVLYAVIRKRWILKTYSSQLLLTILCGIAVAALYNLDHRSSGAGIGLISHLLFNAQDPHHDFLLIAVRFLATTFTYLSGAAGGIFSPSLAIGAAIGAEISRFLDIGHPHLMVLLGMIGFMTGVTRTPFTAFILVMEMTDRHSAVMPMMLASLAAQTCASLFTHHSFYEMVKVRYIEADIEPATQTQSNI